VLDGMMDAGATAAYHLRLYKLFSSHVPVDIANKRVCEVMPDEISKILGSPSLTIGNLRVLRPFMGQVLDLPRRFGVDTEVSSYDLRTMGQQQGRGSLPVTQLREWREADYDAFFALLETEQDKWQQARCLRLFFHFYCPMSQLMRARWDQLWVVKSGIVSGETDEAGNFLQWRYSDKWRGRETLRGASERIARECLERRSEFPNSAFWFPTRFGRRVSHIRSIDHMWRTVLAAQKLSYVSPRLFRMAYRSAYPWHESHSEFMASLSNGRTQSGTDIL
jgi:hypothetical protein